MEDSLFTPFTPLQGSPRGLYASIGPFVQISEDQVLRLAFDVFVVSREGPTTQVTRHELLESDEKRGHDADAALLWIADPLQNKAEPHIEASSEPFLSLRTGCSFTVKGVVRPDTCFSATTILGTDAIGGLSMVEQGGRRRINVIYSVPVGHITLSEDDRSHPGMRYGWVPRTNPGDQREHWSICWESGRMVRTEESRCVITSFV